MSILEKLNIIKSKKRNNEDAIKQRGTYKDSNLDISEEILNITSKPLGQCVTYLRRPTKVEAIQGLYTPTIPAENTIIGNGDGKVVLNVYYQWSGLDIYAGDTIVGNLSFATLENKRFQFYFGSSLVDTVTIKASDDRRDLAGIKASGFSYGDFQPKDNCVMELIIDVNYTYGGHIEINRILVRYINP